MTAAPLPVRDVRAWPMFRALVGVGLACGVLIVSAFLYTEPIIRKNKIEARERAVLQVLPGATSSHTFALAADGDHFEAAPPDREGGRLVFAGYDAAGQLVGVAIEAQATGYQDVVRVVYGYRPADEAVVGMRVLDSRETPGLGDRVESDPGFLRNFERLDVALDPSRGALAHRIEGVKQGQKQHPWQIDCITGATITSSTVARMLGESTATWIPLVARRLDDFRRKE